MATENQIDYPYKVKVGQQPEGLFQEMVGLEMSAQTVDYRTDSSKPVAPTKVPGMAKSRTMTFKKGRFANDSAFWDWHNAIKMNTTQRETVAVYALDEQGKVAIVYTLKNAWATKIHIADLKASIASITVDTLEIAYEALNMKLG